MPKAKSDQVAEDQLLKQAMEHVRNQPKGKAYLSVSRCGPLYVICLSQNSMEHLLAHIGATKNDEDGDLCPFAEGLLEQGSAHLLEARQEAAQDN